MKRSYIQLALSMCLVGINIPLGKIISQSMSVFLFANIRFAIAAVVLVPIVLLKRDKKTCLSKNDLLVIFFQSFFGVFLFSIFMLYGVRYTTAISASIITSTTPAFIAIIAFFLLKEKMNINSTISVVLAVIGIAFISVESGGTLSTIQDNMFGNMLIIFAVISEALFSIYAKLVSNKLHPLQMAALVNIFGFMLFLPFTIHSMLTDHIVILPHMWILIIYYSITASVLSFFLWFRGIAKVPANISGLFTVFMPISAVIVGVIFLHESFTAKQAGGMVLAITAIYVSVRKSHQTKYDKST